MHQQKRNLAAKGIRSLVVRKVPPAVSPAPAERCAPLATGSFLQSWLCAGWNDEQWDDELNDMKAVGITTLILSDTAVRERRKDGGKWTLFYPSSLAALSGSRLKTCAGDVIGAALRKCREHQIGVYLGTGGYADWDFRGGKGPDFPSFCTLSAAVAEELYRLYSDRYPDTIKGWYFVPELNNNRFLCTPYARKFADGITPLLAKLTEIDPALPFLMSPYYTKYFGAAGFAATKKFWDSFLSRTAFRPGDIIAPQDAVGAGWIGLSDSEAVMQMYRAAVDKAGKGVVLWANCENFTQSHTGLLFGPDKTENTAFVPADPGRFQKQLRIVSPYVDNILAFSYNHYGSPRAVGCRDYHDAYAAYYQTVRLMHGSGRQR